MKKKNLMLFIFIGLFVCVGFYFWKKESPPLTEGTTPKESQSQQNSIQSQNDTSSLPEYYEEVHQPQMEEQVHQRSSQQRQEHHQREHQIQEQQRETPIEELNFTQNTYNSQKTSPYQTVNIKL